MQSETTSFFPNFSYDFVYVYDGNTWGATEIGMLTGFAPYLPDNIVSTGQDIYLSLVTDVTETASGFKVKYDAGKNCCN